MTTEPMQQPMDLEGRVRVLEQQLASALAQLAEISNTPGMPTGGGDFALKFPMLVLSPAGVRYHLVRVAGGGLSVVAAPAATSSWSDA